MEDGTGKDGIDPGRIVQPQAEQVGPADLDAVAERGECRLRLGCHRLRGIDSQKGPAAGPRRALG
ncbi:MAG TPA: hypothetical protein VFD37_01265, partial [Solirubrobacterales bacterium]|nr:hypothetical protein [Solirubrobacterales bacterium]